MPRITKAMLEHQNAMLRGEIRDLRTELRIVQSQASMYQDIWQTALGFVQTATVSTERMVDALSHSIGFVTDPKRKPLSEKIAEYAYMYRGKGEEEKQ